MTIFTNGCISYLQNHGRVQGCSTDLPGTARRCPSVPMSVHISRRHPDSTKTSVFHFGRAVCSCCQTAYCWTSCFLCRWRPCLERSSCRRHFSTFSVHFPKTFKTAFSFHSPILALSTKLTISPCVVLVVAFVTQTTLKIYWLIDSPKTTFEDQDHLWNNPIT